jgi:hypothetical protein
MKRYEKIVETPQDALSHIMGGLGREEVEDVTNAIFIAEHYLPRIGKVKLPFKKDDFKPRVGRYGVESEAVRKTLDQKPWVRPQYVDNDIFFRVGGVLSCYNSYELGTTAQFLYRGNMVHMFPEEARMAKKVIEELDDIFGHKKR